MKERVQLEPVSDMAKACGDQMADMLKSCPGCGEQTFACLCTPAKNDPKLAVKEDPKMPAPKGGKGKGLLAKAMGAIGELLAKSQVKGYTKADGTVVKPHSTKVVAHPHPPAAHMDAMVRSGKQQFDSEDDHAKFDAVADHIKEGNMDAAASSIASADTIIRDHIADHVHPDHWPALGMEALNKEKSVAKFEAKFGKKAGGAPQADLFGSTPAEQGENAAKQDAAIAAAKSKAKPNKAAYKLDAQGELAMSGSSKYTKLDGAAQAQARSAKPTQVLKSPNGLFVVPSAAKWCGVLKKQGFTVALDYNGKPPEGGGNPDPHEFASEKPGGDPDAAAAKFGVKKAASSIKDHPNFSADDYEALKGKGYSDAEIKAVWDKDTERNGGQPTGGQPRKDLKQAKEGAAALSDVGKTLAEGPNAGKAGQGSGGKQAATSGGDVSHETKGKTLGPKGKAFLEQHMAAAALHKKALGDKASAFQEHFDAMDKIAHEHAGKLDADDAPAAGAGGAEGPGEPPDAHYAQMESDLANDDSSSDEELVEHWKANGIHPDHAAAAIKHRDAFLTDPIPEQGKLKGLMGKKKPEGGGDLKKGGLAISADLMARIRGPLLKAHVNTFTRRDGSVVAAHETKAPSAKAKLSASGVRVEGESRYEFTHGKRPGSGSQGGGSWMFSPHQSVDFGKHKDGEDYVSFPGPYSSAKQSARKWAAERGHGVIHVQT